MAEASTRSVLLIVILIFPVGQCLDLLELVAGEGNVTSDLAEQVRKITWNVKGDTTGFDIRDSTELVKVNDTGEWSPKNETFSDKVADVGRKVKGFFDNLSSGFLGGSRRKRSTVVPDKVYMGRKGKLWRSFLEEMHGYGGMGFERPFQQKRSNFRWPGPHKWYNWPRMGHEDVPPKKEPPKPMVRTRNRQLTRAQQTYDPTMHSVRMFKQMKNKLMIKKRKKEEIVEREEEQREVPEMMEIYIGGDPHPGVQPQYKCKTGTNGVMSYQEGRTMTSRGLTYSEENQGIRTLLCKAETSEVSQPDQDTLLRNSVIGLNVVTNDNDPFKFIDRGNEIDSETLEIGSQSGSELSYTSEKNQSMSSVSTQGRGAHAQTKANTKFTYENGQRTAFQSAADVEGSTTFNATEDTVPVMLTSRKEESSSILQNPVDNGVESPDIEGAATYMNYKKKVDFDIAFRNLFGL